MQTKNQTYLQLTTYNNRTLPMRSELVGRGERWGLNKAKVDSSPNHVLYQTWSIVVLIININNGNDYFYGVDNNYNSSNNNSDSDFDSNKLLK